MPEIEKIALTAISDTSATLDTDEEGILRRKKMKASVQNVSTVSGKTTRFARALRLKCVNSAPANERKKIATSAGGRVYAA